MEEQCKKYSKKLDNDFSDYCLDCLKFSYSALVKEKQVKKGNLVLESCNKEEVILVVLANIILAVGITASIILTFVMVYNEYGDIRTDGLVIAIATLLSSIAIWAILLYIAKASKNIGEIRNK